MMTLQYSPAFLFVLKHDRIAQDSYQFYWKSKFYNVKENCSVRVLCKIDPNIKIEYIFPVKAKPHTPLDQFCPGNSSSFLKSWEKSIIPSELILFPGLSSNERPASKLFQIVFSELRNRPQLHFLKHPINFWGIFNRFFRRPLDVLHPCMPYMPI